MPIKPEQKIKKEDQRLKLPSDVLAQANAYAKYLSDSSLDYVVAEALRNVMAADKAFQKHLEQNPNALNDAVEKKKGKKPAPLQVMAAAGGQ